MTNQPNNPPPQTPFGVDSASSATGVTRDTLDHRPTTPAYHPALWEKIVAVACAVGVLGVVLFLVVRNTKFADPNLVVLIRIALSVAAAILGAVVPGFLGVDWSVKGFTIRAGGALAIFVISFFFSPKVVQSTVDVRPEQVQRIDDTTAKTQGDIRRVLTSFKSVLVQAVYQLPSDEPAVGSLREALNEVLTAVRVRKSHPSKGLELRYSASATSSLLEVAKFDVADVLSEEYVALSPKLVEQVDLVEWLQGPRLQVGINRAAREPDTLANSLTQHEDTPDLHLFVHNRFDRADGNFSTLILDVRTNQVLVVWNGFEYPQSHWGTSRKIVSIQDLEQSQLVTMLSGTASVNAIIDRIAARSLPVWINVKFDNNFVSFTTLQPAKSNQNWQPYFATFPSAEAILTNKALGGLDPAYSWGF